VMNSQNCNAERVFLHNFYLWEKQWTKILRDARDKKYVMHRTL